MTNKPFRYFRNSFASISLLTATGCASFLATDYREEYANLPESAEREAADQRMMAEQPPSMLSMNSRPEFSNEVLPQPTAEPQVAAVVQERPSSEGAAWPAVAATGTDIAPTVEDSGNSENKLVVNNDAYITDTPEQQIAIPRGSFGGNENPFVAFERDQTEQEVASAEETATQVIDSGTTGRVTNPFEEMTNPTQETPVDAVKLTGSQGVARVSAKSSTSATTFRAAEPRLPGNQPGCPVPASVTVAANQQVQAYPDEYIFDGGDRDAPVHYFGGELEGLDTEDTVAEFKDHTGESHVTASNRVAVYAPRFGAVETVTGPGVDIKVDRAAGARDVAGIGALHEERGMNMNVSKVPASGVAVRSGAGGIESAQPAHMGRKTDSVALNSRVEQGFQAENLSGLNLLEVSDVHELNLQILEPATSDITTFVGQRASTSQATQTYAMFRLASMTGSEDGGVKGAIHITKEATPLIAKSGDVVTFTIHFRNTGDYNVNEVRIIDNLTPRLRYIEGSGEVKVPNGGAGDLAVMPNKDGGQLLQFELDQPLKGGQSGRITFRAKVL